MAQPKLETIETPDLDPVSGGMGADARWIMQHESSGNPRARNAHSTAFGAFQMTIANRRHYMGADYASTDLNKQYAAASHYVRDRYGSWSGARSFWQRHHWY
jgi:trimeric autotransporter adhesin